MYDCGVFAIAFAVSILYSICPCCLTYDISGLRTHLLEIYETRQIKMFPIIKNHFQENIYNNFSFNSMLRNIKHKNFLNELQLKFDVEEIKRLE